MKLFYQTHSPYARKVLVAAHECGLAHAIDVIHHETSPTRPNSDVSSLNPLGKVPVLVTDDGFTLFDSDVICEYLDGLHACKKLIPVDHRNRYRALRRQALAQGIADAGIAARWEAERRPPALRWPTMQDAQTAKIAAACDFLEQEIDAAAPVDIGTIALATALSWVDFRAVYAFAIRRPRLASWYDTFRTRPSMLATGFCGETQD